MILGTHILSVHSGNNIYTYIIQTYLFFKMSDTNIGFAYMVCYHCKLVLLQSFPLIFVSFLYWETIYSFVGDKKLKEVHIKLLLICYLPRFGRASQMEPRASSIDHFHHLYPYIYLNEHINQRPRMKMDHYLLSLILHGYLGQWSI